MRGISWLAENRLASEEGLCSMELDSWSERKFFCGWMCRRVNKDRPQLEGERPGLQSAGLEIGSSAGCCEPSPSVKGETFLEELSEDLLLKSGSVSPICYLVKSVDACSCHAYGGACVKYFSWPSSTVQWGPCVSVC